MSRLVSRPCLTCLCDRTHQGLHCLWCGTATILKPVEFIHTGRLTQRGYKPVRALTVNERKQRWREKNRLRAQKNRDSGAATP